MGRTRAFTLLTTMLPSLPRIMIIFLLLCSYGILYTLFSSLNNFLFIIHWIYLYLLHLFTNALTNLRNLRCWDTLEHHIEITPKKPIISLTSPTHHSWELPKLTDLFCFGIEGSLASNLKLQRKGNFKISATFQSLANVLPFLVLFFLLKHKSSLLFLEIRGAAEEIRNILENWTLIISTPLLEGKRSHKLEIFIKAFKDTRIWTKSFRSSLLNRMRRKIKVERVGRFIQATITWVLWKKVIQLTNYFLHFLGVTIRISSFRNLGSVSRKSKFEIHLAF